MAAAAGIALFPRMASSEVRARCGRVLQTFHGRGQKTRYSGAFFPQPLLSFLQSVWSIVQCTMAKTPLYQLIRVVACAEEITTKQNLHPLRCTGNVGPSNRIMHEYIPICGSGRQAAYNIRMNESHLRRIATQTDSGAHHPHHHPDKPHAPMVDQ